MTSSRSPIPSTTAFDPGLRDLADNALCCAQWGSETGHVGRLGCKFPTASCRVFCKAGFDRTGQAVLFRLCVPVALKTSENNTKTPLYICIEPQHISHLQPLPLDGSEATQACVSDLIAHSQRCSSSADIIALQFLLKQPATMVGPKETTSIEPRSDATGRILESLCSLSLATNLTLYLPKNEALVECIDELCTSASNGSLRSTPKAFGISALYHGAGGMDVGTLLSTFAAGGESRQPPAYQDIARTLEPSTTQSETALSPPQSKADIPPSTFSSRRGPEKRRRTDQGRRSPIPRVSGVADSRDRAWMRRIEQQLLDFGESLTLLRDEIADIRKERERESATPLEFPRIRTVARSVSARPGFAATTQRLDVVEHHLQQMHRRLGAVEDRVREADEECRDLHDERDGELDDRLEDFFTNVNDTVDARLDDWLLDQKADLQDIIKDEMNNIEENIRGDLRGAL